MINKIVSSTDGFYNNNLYYQDTDSTYVHVDHWSVYNQRRFLRIILVQTRNDHGEEGIFSGVFLAREKLFYIFDKCSNMAKIKF